MLTAAPPAADSLAWALLEAAHVCVAVRGGRALPEALADRPVPPYAPARGAVQDLCYRTMRNRGRADALLAEFSERIPREPLLRELLVVALTLLDGPARAEPGSQLPYTPFTLVDQAVAACQSEASIAGAKGFVNAVLRSFLREGARADRAVPPEDTLVTNYPAWWTRRVRAAYPLDWAAILASGQSPAALTLRVNRRRTDVATMVARLEAQGMAATILGESAIRLERAVNVGALPGFLEGLVSVQDEAAQRAAPALELAQGQRVLDACAAPGGKTCHMLEQTDVALTALDSEPKRLVRVTENLVRLGLSARLISGDASHPGEWWDGIPYDRVLADLPCSASGIVRRHPDIRWLRRDSDIAALARRQQQILDALWRVLAPDGKLLLVTCSIFPEEGHLLARDFAMRHSDAVARPTWGQLLPASGPTTDHDGLFFALFDKIAG